MKSKKLITGIALISFVVQLTNCQAQEIISVKKYNKEEVAKIINENLPGKYDIEALKVIYTTTTHDGKKTKASGLLLIPIGTNHAKTPFVVYGHGMTSKRKDVPSELTYYAHHAAFLARNNYITIAPDYIGLGESPGIQPYLYAESYAIAMLDMIKAVRNYVKEHLNVKLRKDIYITGYSEGGEAAMATFKYIEEKNLTDEFRVNACAACSGPYNLSKVMFDYVMYLNTMQYCDPEIMVHLFIGLQSVYKDIYNKTSDFFKAPYDSIVDNYIKNDCNFDLNKYFPVQMNQFIQDSIFTNFKDNPNHPFRIALKKNDTYNWKPKAPLKMYYTKADVKVPYQNAIVAEAEMKKNGANDVEAVQVSETLEHTAAMDPTYKLVLKWFNEIENNINSK